MLNVMLYKMMYGQRIKFNAGHSGTMTAGVHFAAANKPLCIAAGGKGIKRSTHKVCSGFIFRTIFYKRPDKQAPANQHKLLAVSIS
jgi:hypothetical protein